MDRPTQRFGVPDGVHVVGLFGGAIVLAVLGLASVLGRTVGAPNPLLVAIAVTSLALVLGCGAILLRRLRTAAASLARTTRAANESATRLKVLVEHVPAAVYIDIADPDVSDGGRLAYMSPQIAGILGYGSDELIDDPELWPSRIHPDDRAAAIAAYDAHWRTGEPLRAEYRMLARDGSEVWVRDEAFAMADDTRSGQRVSQGLLVDTTDRKRLESRLIHDALHDPLTGLANRVRCAITSSAPWRGRGASRDASPSCSWTSTTSSASTTPSGTLPATTSCAAWLSASLARSARVTSSGARAATSSRSCCST